MSKVDRSLDPPSRHPTRYDFTLPSARVNRAPWTQIEAGYIPVDSKRQRFYPKQVASGIVTRESAHRPRILARHRGRMTPIDEHPSNISCRVHVSDGFYSKELIDRNSSPLIAVNREQCGQRVGAPAGGPHDRVGLDSFAVDRGRAFLIDRTDNDSGTRLDTERRERLADNRARVVAHDRPDLRRMVGKGHARQRRAGVAPRDAQSLRQFAGGLDDRAFLRWNPVLVYGLFCRYDPLSG